MSELELFIKKMQEKYGDEVVVKESTCSEKDICMVPQPLKEVYMLYDEIEFPFGYIHSIESIAADNPFEEEWFLFGFDGFFSYWLCKYEADRNGLWITPWDHDVDDEKECMYADIVEFLTDMEKEYVEREDDEENQW